MKHNKKKKIRIFLIIFVFIIIILLMGKVIINNLIQEQNEIKKLNINVLNNRTDELVFSFSISDFIESYNSLYYKDNKKTYLFPESKWRGIVYDKTRNSNYETYCYYFSEDLERAIFPTINIYVPSNNNDYVQEITINFNYHDYMEEMYNLYEEMCFYTLKVFFNDLTDTQLIEIYKTLNQLACENIYPNENGYYSDSAPYILYYRGNTGIYPYFAIGESMKFCIIPVTQGTIQMYEEQGVPIK